MRKAFAQAKPSARRNINTHMCRERERERERERVTGRSWVQPLHSTMTSSELRDMYEL